jgi:ABC-2 family transporter protein
MTLPAVLFVLRWLIRDTFRQSLANGVFWLMLSVTLIAVAVCLSISTPGLPFDDGSTEYIPVSEARRMKPKELHQQGVTIVAGEIRVGFGAIRVPWERVRENAVHYIQTVLLALIADSGGILLALVWTAGFLPSFLDPASASVLLAKPTPRWLLLIGKFLGVILFVAFQATLFVLGIWLALALRTGVWDMTCFLALPILLLHFSVFFSFSALLAVTTRSTVACVFGSLLFWLVCLGMNLGRHTALTLPELENLSPLFNGLMETGYWVLPKPADLGAILVEALQGPGGGGTDLFRIDLLEQKGAWHPGLSVLASLLAGISLLAVAAREFATADY